MALSQELLKFPNGIRFKNLKASWWDKFGAVKSYYCDRVGPTCRWQVPGHTLDRLLVEHVGWSPENGSHSALGARGCVAQMRIWHMTWRSNMAC